MSPRVSVERVDSVPPNVRVCHYDELDEALKHRFPKLTRRTGRSVCIPDACRTGLANCELVKFTDYYRVDLE